MQTSFSLVPGISVPGQIANDDEKDIVAFPAYEDIPFGRLVELRSDGTVQAYQGGRALGVTVFDATRAPKLGAADARYYQYDEVQVLRKGRIWAGLNGSADPTALGPVNVRAATTDGSGNAQYRGILTSDATSATAGAEIELASGVEVFRAAVHTDGVVLVTLNMP